LASAISIEPRIAVHAGEREQMPCTVGDRDVHRHVDAGGVRASTLEHRLRARHIGNRAKLEPER
jgi:hypothetical protein